MRVEDGGRCQTVQTRELRRLLRYLLQHEEALFPRSQHAGKVLLSWTGDDVLAVPTNHSIPRQKVPGDE